jgi:lipopolysaccharide/colanic/teichoic acid biosynthesis glycosyltransferase
MLKRSIDFAAAGLGLVVLAPLLVLIALAIKLDSAGPVFFRQERVGLGGRHFRIFKFRTMYVGAEQRGPAITAAGDERITRVGRFLRRHKLDELPQLIDVLRGTMSLVGPRPELPRFVLRYPPLLRERILSVRPGVTDAASLRFKGEADTLARASHPEKYYVEVILPEKLRVAVDYLEASTVASDLRLVGLTLRTVFVPSSPFREVRTMMRNPVPWRIVARMLDLVQSRRRVVTMVVDSLLVLACWHLSYLFRMGFERWQPARPAYDDAVSLGAIVLYMGALTVMGASRSLWQHFAFDDFRRVALACAMAGVVGAAAIMLAQLHAIPRAVLVLHPLFCFLALVIARMAFRLLWEHAQALIRQGDGRNRYAVVLGAGDVGRRVLAGLHLSHGWHVLKMFDDREELHGLRIAGVPVAGPVSAVSDPTMIDGATHVIIALTDADSDARERALTLAERTGLVILTVPVAEELRVVVSESRCA